MLIPFLSPRERCEALENSRREEWLENMKEYLESLSNEEAFDPPFLDRRGYIFDLDAVEVVNRDNENDDDGSSHQKYSVDAWSHGELV